jgi:hypothetical protein
MVAVKEVSELAKRMSAYEGASTKASSLQDPKTLRDNDLQDATGILARSEEQNDETSRKDQRRKIRHASVTTFADHERDIESVTREPG